MSTNPRDFQWKRSASNVQVVTYLLTRESDGSTCRVYFCEETNTFKQVLTASSEPVAAPSVHSELKTTTKAPRTRTSPMGVQRNRAVADPWKTVPGKPSTVRVAPKVNPKVKTPPKTARPNREPAPVPKKSVVISKTGQDPRFRSKTERYTGIPKSFKRGYTCSTTGQYRVSRYQFLSKKLFEEVLARLKMEEVLFTGIGNMFAIHSEGGSQISINSDQDPDVTDQLLFDGLSPSEAIWTFYFFIKGMTQFRPGVNLSDIHLSNQKFHITDELLAKMLDRYKDGGGKRSFLETYSHLRRKVLSDTMARSVFNIRRTTPKKKESQLARPPRKPENRKWGTPIDVLQELAKRKEWYPHLCQFGFSGSGEILLPVSLTHFLAPLRNKNAKRVDEVLKDRLKGGFPSHVGDYTAEQKAVVLAGMQGDKTLKSLRGDPKFQKLGTFQDVDSIIIASLGQSWFTDYKARITYGEIIVAQEVALAYLDQCIMIDPWYAHNTFVQSAFSKCFERAIRQRDEVIQYNKTFCQFVLEELSRSKPRTRDELLKIKDDSDNFFFGLLAIPQFRKLLEARSKCHSLERLCSAMTTRGFPKPTKLKEDKSFKDFVKIISKEKPVSFELLTRVKNLSIQLGKMCMEKYENDLPDDVENRVKKDPRSLPVKCDIGTSACLELTAAEGGRSGFFRQYFMPWIMAKTTEEETYKFPEEYKIPIGAPRYLHFAGVASSCEGLPEDPLEPQPSLPTGSMMAEAFGQQHCATSVCGRFLGLQFIHYCLYVHKPIRVKHEGGEMRRVDCSPILECGGKVRWITISSICDLIPQDVVQETIRPLLCYHPRIEPIFRARDQAWHFCGEILGPEIPVEGDGRYYSSDYSNATDAIGQNLARCLLEGFLSGAEIPIEGVFKTAIDTLCSPKLVYRRGDRESEPILATRGIFMGEPLTKCTLTILMYVLDRIAIEDYMSHCSMKHVDGVVTGPEGRVWYSFDKPWDFNPPWWDYFAPGDDHVAHGPEGYIKILKELSNRLEMILNDEKTSHSDVIIPLCQRYLFVPYLFGRGPDKMDLARNYAKSPWLDAPKLKTFSPISVDYSYRRKDPVVVTGRARMLEGTLSMLAPTWTVCEKKQLRDYFVKRYCDEMPDRTMWQFHYAFLPTSIGGLGLAIDDQEAQIHYDILPDKVKAALYTLVKSDSSDLRVKVARICQPISIKGLDDTEAQDYATIMIHQITEGCDTVHVDDQQVSRIYRTTKELESTIRESFFYKNLMDPDSKSEPINSATPYSKRLEGFFHQACSVTDFTPGRRPKFCVGLKSEVTNKPDYTVYEHGHIPNDIGMLSPLEVIPTLGLVRQWGKSEYSYDVTDSPLFKEYEDSRPRLATKLGLIL